MPRAFQPHPRPGGSPIGVDTNADVHVAAAGDQFGPLRGSLAIPTTVEPYTELPAWAEGFDTSHVWALNGTRPVDHTRPGSKHHPRL